MLITFCRRNSKWSPAFWQRSAAKLFSCWLLRWTSCCRCRYCLESIFWLVPLLLLALHRLIRSPRLSREPYLSGQTWIFVRLIWAYQDFVLVKENRIQFNSLIKPSSSSYVFVTVFLTLVRRLPSVLPLTLSTWIAVGFCGDGVLFSFSFFTGAALAGASSSSSDESQICIRRDRAGIFSILDFLLAGLPASGEFSSSFESVDVR